jgi:hypothetical protein
MTRRPVISFVRTWLPALVVLGGVLLIVIERTEVALEGGAGIIGAGLSIWLFNVLLRVGNDGEKDRREEEDAREHFDRTGHWPDESPGAPAEDPRLPADPHRRTPARTPAPRR